jgi:hypothetical protein
MACQYAAAAPITGSIPRGLELSLALCLVGFPRGKIGNRRPGPRLLIHEPAKQSRKPAKLDLLTLEPGVQPAVGDRGRGIAATSAFA